MQESPHRTTPYRAALYRLSTVLAKVHKQTLTTKMHFRTTTVSAIYMSSADSERIELVYHATCAFVSVHHNRTQSSRPHIQHLLQQALAQKKNVPVPTESEDGRRLHVHVSLVAKPLPPWLVFAQIATAQLAEDATQFIVGEEHTQVPFRRALQLHSIRSEQGAGQ